MGPARSVAALRTQRERQTSEAEVFKNQNTNGTDDGNEGQKKDKQGESPGRALSGERRIDLAPM